MYISVCKIMLFNLIQLYQFKWRMIFKKHVKYYLMKKIRFCVTVSEKTVLLEQFFLSKWKIRILFENCVENREYFLNCQKNLIRKSWNEQNKIIFFLKWQRNQLCTSAPYLKKEKYFWKMLQRELSICKLSLLSTISALIMNAINFSP